MGSQAFIRPYNLDTDNDAILHIFRETCDAPLKVEPTWTIGSLLWAVPYTRLEPSTCFVLDDGTGRAVGYILGTPNTANFARRWRDEYLPSLDRNQVPECPREDPKGRNAALLVNLWDTPENGLNNFDGVWDSFPGHLHIDILASHQGQGWGPRLMQTLLGALRDKGCPSVHLGMSVTNKGALRFYERIGFRRFPKVLDGGVSGELGQYHGTIVMVREL